MIYLVGGARPNFMKIASLSRAFEKYNIDYEIIHTGQHYDYNMDKTFFKEFNLKEPLVKLNVGSGSHGEQTGKIMQLFESVCQKGKPDMVFTVGDINSTMAAALVAAKLHIPVAHQEAGMRSGDKKMPEEINRIVTDHVSEFLFPISPQDKKNLIKEGISKKNIHLVGDPMIDNLLYYSNKIEEPDKYNYILVELHRPANVDDPVNLKEILKSLQSLSMLSSIIFSLHPRTKKMIHKFNYDGYLDYIDVYEPMGYFEFMKYMKHAAAVITDSDGIQQETSILNVPCISIRDTTNIAYTIKYGTNTLVDARSEAIASLTTKILFEKRKKSKFPKKIKKLNDGNAAERIVKVLMKEYFRI